MARGSTSRQYKPQISHDRVITEERAFNLGMHYSTTEQDIGNAKIIANLVPDRGSGALESLPQPQCSMITISTDAQGYNYQSACSGQLSVPRGRSVDDIVDAYVLIPTARYNSKMPCTLESGFIIAVSNGQDYEYHPIDCTHDGLIVDDDEELPVSCMYIPKEVPDFWIADDKCIAVGAEYIPNKLTMYGVFPSVFFMNNKLFLYVWTRYMDDAFYKASTTEVDISKYEGLYTVDTATWKLERVTPKEVAVANAVSSGYNLLKDDPYSFVNGTSATGEVQLQGLLPLNIANDKVLMRTKVNSYVKYRLVYNYPTADAEDKYYVAWKIQDNNSSKDPEMLRPLKKSIAYTPGDNIEITFLVPYENFTLICELYKKTEMDRESAAWEEDESLQSLIAKEDYHTPNQTITVTSAYIADSSKGEKIGETPIAYAAQHPLGAIVWRGRCVTWGFRFADNGSDKQDGMNIVMLSDADDPSYVPYPNNAIVFNDSVLACTVYRDSLIVFTKHAIYKVVLDIDGLTPISTLVQAGFDFSDHLVADIISDNNFVMVRTLGGYAMLCPSQYTTSGIQLVSISDKLGNLSNKFSEMLDTTLVSMYPHLNDMANNPFISTLLRYALPGDKQPVIKDTTNRMLTYVDNWDYIKFVDHIKYAVRGHVLSHIPTQNTFMDTFKIMLPTPYNDQVAYAPAFVDVSLCYNTQSRAWSLRIQRSSEQVAALLEAGEDYDRWITVADAHWYKPVQRAYNNVWEVPHKDDEVIHYTSFEWTTHTDSPLIPGVFVPAEGGE